MIARLQAIIAGSRKALVIYALWLLIVALQCVSCGGSLIRCANNPVCSWLDFIAIVQKAIENISLVTAAAGGLLPTLMALEDAFAKFGLPPAAATSLQVSTTTTPDPAAGSPASTSTVTATVSSPLSAPAPASTLEPTKETTTMSIVQKQIPVSEGLHANMKALEELIADVMDGRPSAEVQSDVLALLGNFAKLGEVPKDYEADPESVQNAIFLAGDDFGRRIIAILQKRRATGEPR